MDDAAWTDALSFITERLAVGEAAAGRHLPTLRRSGITAIVDASNEEGNPRFPGIAYLDVPIADPDERIVEFIPRVVAFVDDHLSRGRVLIHCVAGISRSPSLALCYLHEKEGWSLEEALARIQARRERADPHPTFRRVLRDYYSRPLRLRLL